MACLKVVLSFFEKISKFFGIFNGENTLFTKNGLVSEKIILFLPLLIPDPKVEFSSFFLTCHMTPSVP